MPSLSASATLHPARATSVEGRYVFTVAPVYDTTVFDVAQLTFELQLDTTPSFQSVNRKIFYGGDMRLASYEDGVLAKGFVVNLPGRTRKIVMWYARARAFLHGQAQETWSPTQRLEISANTAALQATASQQFPNGSVYSLEANSTNMAQLVAAAYREKDQLDLEILRTQQDIYLASARDAALQDAFQAATQLAKPSTLSNADYRHQMLMLWKALTSYPGSWQAVIDFVTAVVGEPPVVYEVSSPVGWVLPYHYLPDPDFPLLSPTTLLYPRPTDGNQFDIYIFNSWSVEFDHSALEEWIERLKPAHTRATVVFPTAKHTSVRFDAAAQWATCSITGGTVVGDTVVASSPTMVITTPELDGSTEVQAWDFAQWDLTLSGQTATIEIRSHPAGGGWSAWEIFTAGGHAPFTTAPERFFQLRVTTTSVDVSLYKPILKRLEFFFLRGS